VLLAGFSLWVNPTTREARFGVVTVEEASGRTDNADVVDEAFAA
jgi:hypothetical protein